jgi:hypothetical protein
VIPRPVEVPPLWQRQIATARAVAAITEQVAADQPTGPVEVFVFSVPEALRLQALLKPATRERILWIFVTQTWGQA